MNKHCKNCGIILHGKYCYSCGQKIILPGDKKLSHLLTEFFHHFTHLDGKFLKTLRNILWRPGKVTRDISKGITVPHFKLSAFFLVGTIIYYLLPAGSMVITPANQQYHSQVTDDDYHEWKLQYAVKKSLSNNISLHALEKRYNERQHSYGKFLILLLIPMLIPVLWVIAKLIKIFNTDNEITAYDLGVAALEINSIILYGLYLIAGLTIWLATSIYGSEKITLAGVIIFIPSILLLLFLFFKRAYEITWWQALICLTLLIFAYLYVLKLFGLICFFIFIH